MTHKPIQASVGGRATARVWLGRLAVAATICAPALLYASPNCDQPRRRRSTRWSVAESSSLDARGASGGSRLSPVEGRSGRSPPPVRDDSGGNRWPRSSAASRNDRRVHRLRAGLPRLLGGFGETTLDKPPPGSDEATDHEKPKEDRSCPHQHIFVGTTAVFAAVARRGGEQQDRDECERGSCGNGRPREVARHRANVRRYAASGRARARLNACPSRASITRSA